MDEPASALDPIATSKIEETITELKQDYTIVIVTHGAVISAALAYWVDRNTLRWSHYATTQNTAVSELLFDERIELVRYNDTSHLAEELVL